MRVSVLALFAATLAIAVPSARAADPAAPQRADADAKAWVGRYCTPTGCAGGPSSPVAHAASFGTAAVAVAFLSRRRRA